MRWRIRYQLLVPCLLPLAEETARILRGLPWFGNVRELHNALEHAAIVAHGGPLLPDHFPSLVGGLGGLSPQDRLASAVRKKLALYGLHQHATVEDEGKVCPSRKRERRSSPALTLSAWTAVDATSGSGINLQKVAAPGFEPGTHGL